MDTRHPKSVRRRLLQILYERYQADPLEMLAPEDVLADGTVLREDISANMHYLQERGFVELMMGYNPPLFAAVRITADGIDLVENPVEFDLFFPPSLNELEQTAASIPMLMERLAWEVENSPVDGEERHALLRDVHYLREELNRPPHRWRMNVIRATLSWIQEPYTHLEDGVDGALPSLLPLANAIEETHRKSL